MLAWIITGIIGYLFMLPVVLLVLGAVWFANWKGKHPSGRYGEVLCRWPALVQPAWPLAWRLACYVGGLVLIVAAAALGRYHVLAGLVAGLLLALDLGMWLRVKLEHETLVTSTAIISGDFTCSRAELRGVETCEGMLYVHAVGQRPYPLAAEGSPEAEALAAFEQLPPAHPMRWRPEWARYLMYGVMILSWLPLGKGTGGIVPWLVMSSWLVCAYLWALERRLFLLIPIPFMGLIVPLPVRLGRPINRAALFGLSLLVSIVAFALDATLHR